MAALCWEAIHVAAMTPHALGDMPPKMQFRFTQMSVQLIIHHVMFSECALQDVHTIKCTVAVIANIANQPQ